MKARIWTLVAPFTWTIAFSSTRFVAIVAGALMIAARRTSERMVVLLSSGLSNETCSAYVPGQTLIVEPGGAASTAASIELDAGASEPQLLGALARPSSSTMNVAAAAFAVPTATTPTSASSEES